jgi:hypothetical protein
MELEKMIKELINSNIIENEELALTLLGSDQVTKEEKRKAIDKYIKSLVNGDKTLLDAEHQSIFKKLIKIYATMQEGEVKNRVKKI